MLKQCNDGISKQECDTLGNFNRWESSQLTSWIVRNLNQTCTRYSVCATNKLPIYGSFFKMTTTDNVSKKFLKAYKTLQNSKKVANKFFNFWKTKYDFWDQENI